MSIETHIFTKLEQDVEKCVDSLFARMSLVAVLGTILKLLKSGVRNSGAAVELLKSAEFHNYLPRPVRPVLQLVTHSGEGVIRRADQELLDAQNTVIREVHDSNLLACIRRRSRRRY